MRNLTRRRSAENTQELRIQARCWLRELRLTCGLSQRELARRLEARHTFVSQVENGR